jgi:hypothetical protein
VRRLRGPHRLFRRSKSSAEQKNVFTLPEFKPHTTQPIVQSISAPDLIEKKGKGKVFPLHAMKAYRGSRGTFPLIPHLNTRRK